VHEGLSFLATLDFSPQNLVICIDHTAAINTLQDNNSDSGPARIASTLASLLVQKGWKNSSLWTPAHRKIEGNEHIDEMAKKGAESLLNLCPRSFSSKTWLKAESTRRLLQNWKNSHNIIGSSRRYPPFIESIPYNDSRALFRAFCGRTPSDPHYPYEQTPCKCGIEICTSAHLITSCRLLDHTRSIKLKITSELSIPTQFSKSQTMQI
jgi:ribonuclease HI